MNPLPFAHLNLRRNPFGELTVAERTELAVVNISNALQHLKQSRAAVQIVGEKGFGKTTHLISLATHFPGHAYLHIPEGERGRIPASGEPLFIDEAQRLTTLQRWRMFHSDRRIVLGTHTDFERSLRDASRPVLTIAANQFTNETRVHTLLNARIEFVRRGVGRVPLVTLTTAAALLNKFGSDIRSMEHSLYHIFQQLREIQDV